MNSYVDSKSHKWKFTKAVLLDLRESGECNQVHIIAWESCHNCEQEKRSKSLFFQKSLVYFTWFSFHKYIQFIQNEKSSIRVWHSGRLFTFIGLRPFAMTLSLGDLQIRVNIKAVAPLQHYKSVLAATLGPINGSKICPFVYARRGWCSTPITDFVH